MKKIVVLFLFLVACQFAQLPAKKIPEAIPIYTGTSALEASFNPATMSNMIMCQQSDIYVDVKNTGAQDIKDGTYSFITEDQYLTPVTERQKKFSLEGKSQFNPKGGFDQIHLRVKNLGILPQFETYNPEIIFQACYKYTTSAAAQVCVDPDVANLNPRKACRPEPVLLPNGQGAPVAVTKIEPYMVPEGDGVTPVFAIYVQNLGFGAVVRPEGAEAACTGGTGLQLLSYANVHAFLQNKELVCDPNPVKIESTQERRFICQRKEMLYGPSAGTFSAVLTIQLEYGYVNSLALPLTITRLPGQAPCPT